MGCEVIFVAEDVGGSFAAAAAAAAVAVAEASWLVAAAVSE